MSTQTGDPTDILIIGGGLNGPALALALAGAGFTVTVIDARPAGTLRGDSFDGRAYALALASVRVLDALGVWPRVAAQAQPILRIVASDGRAGEGASPLALAFDHAEIEEGPMGQMIEDRFLRRALLDACDADGRITLVNGDPVVAQAADATGGTVTLASGRRHAARLLVGCDGRASPTAARAGIARSGRDYGQTALVCAVAHERPHQGTAHQLFLPAGPLAILPLPGNRCSIVWSETTERARALAQASDEDFLAALRPAFGSFLGDISLAGERYAWPLRLSLASSFIAPRLALVGDAAHGIHPIAGQGLNLGMRDLAALAEVLTEARRRGEDIAAAPVLERYQRWRRFDTTAMALGTDMVNRLFSNNNPLLRAARDLGLGAVSALPALRRHFIREAAGLTGDLPRLMQGRPL
ncbi:MAG: FAD-dependent monooxygenase [Rhodobacteraceae bacterium]|nr:FAD-dependent monooxygenase [Paracoccaceae bacterium]